MSGFCGCVVVAVVIFDAVPLLLLCFAPSLFVCWVGWGGGGAEPSRCILPASPGVLKIRPQASRVFFETIADTSEDPELQAIFLTGLLGDFLPGAADVAF